MRQRILAAIGVLTALWFGNSRATADLTPVLFYDASIYNDAIPIDGAIEDQSAANNDGLVRFADVGVSSDVPTGMSGKSFDLTGIGMFESLAARLLLNDDPDNPSAATIKSTGGFVMEAWFKHDEVTGSGTGKVIDYGGYERIQFAGSGSGVNPLNNKTQFEFRTSNLGHRVGGRLPAELDNNWHYALAEFVVTDATDPANLLGQMRITVDGQADVKVNGGKTNQGDNAINANTLEYTSKIAIGTRSTVNPANPGGSGDNLEGLVYQPKVWLGTIADPVRLVVNTATGAVSLGYVDNATIPGATRFGTRISSYSITSAAGSLRPANLNSLQTQNLDPNPGIGEDGRFDGDNDADGADFLLWQRSVIDAGAAPFTEANSNADPKINEVDLATWQAKFGSLPHWATLTNSTTSISEIHGTHGTVVSSASPIALGAAFDPTKPQDLVFTYMIDGDPSVHNGIIQYAGSSAAVPEPSAFALAIVALAGVRCGWRRRIE
jgi:hypothetical protein